MKLKAREEKPTLNKADRNESETIRNAVANGTSDRRAEVRRLVAGDILWSYVADGSETCFKGTIINENESGLCILTLEPIEVASVLRIYGKDRLAVIDAIVIRCRKYSIDIYKLPGLLLSKS
ncbi:MAG: hypothetical protein P8Z71_12510 [Candidatus Sulfobium sp.]